MFHFPDRKEDVELVAVGVVLVRAANGRTENERHAMLRRDGLTETVPWHFARKCQERRFGSCVFTACSQYQEYGDGRASRPRQVPHRASFARISRFARSICPRSSGLHAKEPNRADRDGIPRSASLRPAALAGFERGGGK